VPRTFRAMIAMIPDDQVRNQRQLGTHLLGCWQVVGESDVPCFGKPFSIVAVELRVRGGPRSQPVHVAVVHTEGGRDQDGVVNLLVACAMVSGRKPVTTDAIQREMGVPS
jgi:hypothetical protein